MKFKGYDPKKIEAKWQKYWVKKKLYRTTEDASKETCYVLDMFPYISGEGLHVGHPKGYVATDVYSRFKKMSGYNILHPMGYDAFGLPTENYAIKNKIHPEISVKKNIKRFKEQLSIMGFNYDWEREFSTTDPEYYRWTQWIFLQMFKKGLAYESYEPINWCPVDKTGLANEDVEDGKCERCGALVEKRPMRQWVLRITDYADRLLNDLEGLTEWPVSIKEAQKNWIGKSEGAEIDFEMRLKINKPRFLILHGYKGAASANFIPWLKRILEGKGFDVEAPDMPNTMSPREDEQVQYVLDNCKIDHNTVVIGHSLGGAVAMKLLTKLGKKVGGLVLVATAIDPNFKKGKKPRAYWDTFSWNYDYELIKKLTDGKVAILSDTQEKDRAAYLKFLADKLSALLLDVKAEEEHFCANEEPAVLKCVTPLLTVFTTRADTIFGVTYLAISPEHPWVDELLPRVENKQDVVRYIESAKKKTEIERTSLDKEKTGVELKGVKAINPATNQEIPIWVADYVLANYGTGAIMAVPAHDERDRQFAEKFNLPIVDKPFIQIEEAVKKYGKGRTTYRLRDWVFSRQRYWGEPIPLIHCDKCGVVPVPEKDLPVKLPKVKHYEPTDTGESPLAAIDKWVNVKCPQCKGKAKRETNTMPQWAGSCWYYLRFIDSKNKKAFVDKGKEKSWMPVDLYVGGAEHATRHLIYARFWHKFLYDIGAVSTLEPFTRLHSVGLIAAEDGRKMSKRYGNVVNPDDVINLYGADTFRLYEMFMGPFGQGIAWSTNNMIGSRRFLERVWNMQELVSKDEPEAVTIALHKMIKKVAEDIESFSFNTAVSAMMIFGNVVYEHRSVTLESYKSFLILLSPFAPHMTEELWSMLGEKKSIYSAKWPGYDERTLQSANVTIAVQINGKTRTEIQVEHDAPDKEVEQAALNDEKVLSHTKGFEVERVIVVKNRLINIVIS